ncbi:unnamed protein product [Taenia asiatica]|uniref:Malate dehydrogenase n=1 Tax=Taenia asiatica TaxID=60517 RepID=A0A0R3VWP4_TAEAS|nr:unnamed protein product [Taenia asiatica]
MIFENSRVDPEDHHFLMAMLALVTSWGARKPKESSLTGIVVEFGGGVTQIMPIVEGCGVGPTVKHILIAGRDITAFIQLLLLERELGIPSDLSMEAAKKIKGSIRLGHRKEKCDAADISMTPATVGLSILDDIM